jgi:hypothetical protein
VLSHSRQEPFVAILRIFDRRRVIAIPRHSAMATKVTQTQLIENPGIFHLALDLADPFAKILSRNWYEPIFSLRACAIYPLFVYAENTEDCRSSLEMEEVEKHVSLLSLAKDTSQRYSIPFHHYSACL